MKTDFDLDLTGDPNVVAWRERRLEAAGFVGSIAGALAADCSFDLHRLINLVESGCPPELAVRILAPLENESLPC
jgi:hypothetical protein